MQIKKSNIAIAASIGLSAAGLMAVIYARRKRNITVKARIIGFHVADVHTAFEEGAEFYNNATELIVVSPKIYRRKLFLIYHPNDEEVPTIWRQIGTVIEFSIPRKYFIRGQKNRMRLCSNRIKLG